MSLDFGPMHRKWTSCDPFTLFDAPVETKVAEDKKCIERNLIAEARKSQMLMIWTDCDREGENIGMEVAKVCRKANPSLRIKRARFSAIIAQYVECRIIYVLTAQSCFRQIHHAAQHPVELDKAQADAVDARTILDLRLGAAFTRMQSLILQPRFGELGQQTISYGRNVCLSDLHGNHLDALGPCQFPTLGFVVSRYEQVQSFSPESFWYIFLSRERSSNFKLSDEEGEATEFTWRRGRLFDFDVSLAIYEGVLNNPTAKVTSVAQKATKKW